MNPSSMRSETANNQTFSSPAAIGVRVSSLLALLISGCSTQVVPPSHPADAVNVYLTDYGKHSSVVLPVKTGGYDEYAFGDWDYFAQGHNGIFNAIRALLGSPQATLGRRHLDAQPDDTAMMHLLGANRLMRLAVERKASDSLLNELDARFRSDGNPIFYSDYSKLYHVPDPEHYWGGNNCNHVTAGWLRKLGCEIHGSSVWSNFYLDEPDGESATSQAR